jgi:DNA polymerase-3 subunit alpha
VDGSYEGANHLTVLVKDQAGYKNLIKLVTAGFLEGFYYKPRVDRELLKQHAKGLLVLSGCLNSEVCRLLMEGQEARAKEAAAWYRDVFGPENYYMEMQWHGIPEQKTVNEGVIRIARSLGLPLVATNDVHYLNQTDFRAHEILLCIQTGKTVNDKDRMRFSVNEFYLKSPEQMADLFRDYPEALKNTVSVAERCNLELEFGKIHLPHYQVPAGQTLESYLAELAWKGLRARFPSLTPQQEERLKAELGVIQRMGYAGYFLIVWDFIRFAKERGISVGPGRGSAAGSLVAYALGITNIDPLRYGLLFERFLNPERVSMPDMDIDFSYERRDEVINYVTEKYGKDNVAQIITFGTLGAKAVIRDVGRALGFPYSEADKLAKMVPATLNITLDDALGQSPALSEAVRTRPEVGELWQAARALEGLTRHASTHAAGVVISRDPLTEHVPLYRGAKGEVTTQYAMGAIEKIGLLKMDFLGLRTLSVISNTLDLIRDGQGKTLDIEAIPPDDEKTFRLLGEARTNGVFQLESAGMRDLLRRLRPGRLEDVIALVALYRPGPMVMIDDFIARRHGRVKVTYDHPALEEILKDTYGVMVYQEQVMRIAGDLAGFSMGEADLLRRAMGKKDPELMEKTRKKFLDGAKAKGIPARTAEKIFDLMAPFAGYAFNLSHAAAYAVVAHQTAYLKAHYPVEFMAALLTSEMADTDKIVKYIEECRAMGITVLPPDVNESGSGFKVVGEKIRFGLVAVKNVGDLAIHSILESRTAKGRFKRLYDFCQRVDLRLVNKRVLESLIKCGAFDSLGARRAQLMATVDQAMEAASSAQRDRAQGQVSLLEVFEAAGAGAAATPGLPDVPEWSRAELLAAERETLGFYITGHPLAEYEAVTQRLNATRIDALPGLRDKETVRVCGIVSAVKEISTKNGDRMAFVTLEDQTGSVETVAFPDLYRAKMLHLVKDAAVLVTGQVDITEDSAKLLLSDVEPLDRLRGKAPRAVRLTVAGPAATPGALQRLRELVAQHPGPAPITLALEVPGGPALLEADAGCAVAAGEAFVAAAEALLGRGAVLLLY